MTGEQPVLGVRDRLAAAGLSVERVKRHRAAGLNCLDGEPVEDLDHTAPARTRSMMSGGW